MMLRSKLFIQRAAGLTARRMNSTMPAGMDQYEQQIYAKLKDQFQPQDLMVKDVSGGCGSMFAINIQSTQFKGVPMIKQHRLVNEVLKEDIAEWHGLQLKTGAPKE